MPKRPSRLFASLLLSTLALFAMQASAAWSGLRSVGTVFDGATSSSQAIDAPDGCVAGDLLVMFSSTRSTENSGAGVDTPSGFVRVTDVADASRTKAWAKPYVSETSVTLTIGGTPSTDNWIVQTACLNSGGATGYSVADLLDVTNGLGGSNEADIPTAALTPIAEDGELILQLGNKAFRGSAGFLDAPNAGTLGSCTNSAGGNAFMMCWSYEIQGTASNLAASAFDLSSADTGTKRSSNGALMAPDGAPTFDAGVAYVSATVTAMTVSFDASANATTYYCGLYAAGATPTPEQVKAGTGAHGTATGATTGSSQQVAITATDNPVWPYYSPQCVLEN